MKIVVASKNPVKIEAARRAFVLYFGKEAELNVIGVEAQSGVSEQPMDITETSQGAYNRAKHLLSEAKDADYTVGIEGGLSHIQLHDQSYTMEQSWICVWHCKSNKHEMAGTPAFPILPNILEHVKAGSDLSSAMELEYGLKDLGKKEGYIGWLTDKVMDRTSYSVESIFLALCSLHKEK